MEKKNIFTFIAILSIVSSNELNSLFARDYFSNKQVNQLATFACWSSSETMHLIKLMTESNIKVSYFDDNENYDMKSLLKVNYYKLGIFLDLDCPQKEDIFNQFVSVNKLSFNVSYFWLVITKSDQLPIEILENLPLTVATELTIALVHKNNTYIMYDVYNHSYRHGGKLNTTYMGFWNQNDGINNFLNQYKYKRRGNFYGMVLNFSTVLINTPQPDLKTYLATPTNPHLDPMGRFHYELIKQLSEAYNFTIHMTVSKSWGYIQNGTVGGLIGDMVKGIVDISALPFIYNNQRLDFCDLTIQTYFASPAFIFRHPKKNNIHNVFLHPFEKNVWWVIFIFGIICWPIMSYTIRKETQLTNENAENRGLYSNPKTGTFLVVLAAITQQDSNDVPKFYSNRIFFFSLFLSGMIMFQFYSASIVGSLLAERPRFINTIFDLLNSDIEIGIEDVAYNHNFLREPPDDRCKALKKRVDENTIKGKRSFMNVSEGLSKMKNGRFAYLVDVATAYRLIEKTFTENEICDLVEIRAYTGHDLGILTQKHSPFNKLFVYGMRTTIAGGIVRRHRTVWYPRKPQCPVGHSSKPVPVEFGEFSSAIFLLIGGLSVAAFILIVETILQRKIQQYQTPQISEQDTENSQLDMENSQLEKENSALETKNSSPYP